MKYTEPEMTWIGKHKGKWHVVIDSGNGSPCDCYFTHKKSAIKFVNKKPKVFNGQYHFGRQP